MGRYQSFEANLIALRLALCRTLATAQVAEWARRIRERRTRGRRS